MAILFTMLLRTSSPLSIRGDNPSTSRPSHFPAGATVHARWVGMVQGCRPLATGWLGTAWAVPPLCSARHGHTLTMSLASRLGTIAGSSKFIAKHYYPSITRNSVDDLEFINMGYEEDPPMALPLAASDEPNRYFIQLYHRTATQAELKGKKVLEVSCGHGGGASYLVRTADPASYTGLDLNSEGIDRCRKSHTLPGLDFVCGNADKLPFADQSFDAVINVEASTYYPSLPGFLAEVARVLRPGGHFLYSDIRYGRKNIAKWEEEMSHCPMRLNSERDISEQVACGVEKNVPRYRELNPGTPPWLTNILLGRIRRELRNGEFSWRMYCFEKEWGGVPKVGGVVNWSVQQR
jgi:SAM-dependent methyltransferase